jgi:PAP2 superfamily
VVVVVSPIRLTAQTRRARQRDTQNGSRESRLRRGWIRELALFGAVDLLYEAGRGLFAAQLPTARAHADWVINLERSLHVSVEASVQHALSGKVFSFLLANIYLAAQLVVLPAALIWVYRRSRGVYRSLRNTVIGVWMIALPVFALFPVAPPRLAGISLKDTVSQQGGISLTGHSTMFYNPYAAVPSLHVGLAFAIGIAVAATLRRRYAKVLALAWGPIVTVAVVATGNHYTFDAATGLLATAVAFAFSRLVLESRRWVKPGRSVPGGLRPQLAGNAPS